MPKKAKTKRTRPKKYKITKKDMERAAKETDKVRKELGQPSIAQQRKMERLEKETDAVRKELRESGYPQPTVRQQRVREMLHGRIPYKPKKKKDAKKKGKQGD